MTDIANTIASGAVVAIGALALVIVALWLADRALTTALKKARAWRLVVEFIWHRARHGHFPCKRCPESPQNAENPRR